MKTGLYISGIGHAVLILWLLFGSLFSWSDDQEPLRVTEVSILSEAQFAALTSPEPQPTAPTVSPAPTRRPPPEPDRAPEPEPEPPAPEPTPPPVPDAPPAPEVVPEQADRVAPVPTPEPAPEVQEAPELVEAPEPEPAENVAEPVEEVTPTAPPETTTEIVTEADRTGAPETSVRPQRRPNRPAPQPDPEPETETPVQPSTDAIDDALAEALGRATDTPAPTGPPLTRGERDGLRIAVGSCWNLGSQSTDALQTTVVVLVQMSPEGKPQGIALHSSNGPNDTATDIAFRAARRAILRCGADGFGLPTEKYEQWREIEMTFDPSQMRTR